MVVLFAYSSPIFIARHVFLSEAISMVILDSLLWYNMYKWGWKLAISIVLSALLMATCFTNTVVNAQTSQGAPDHINVILFYHKGCCSSCGEMEKYVGDALNQYYGNEMKSGMVTYQVVDPVTDKAMADKYNVKDWALKLVVTRGGQESVVDIPEVWMYVGNKDAAMKTVKNAIDKQLGR